MDGGIAVGLLAATPSCRRGIPAHLGIEPDRQRAAALERFIVGWPVPGPVGRGCRSAHVSQLPRWIHEMNPTRDLCNRAGWMDSFVIPKGAANIENAKTFINFMSAPENATIQYNYYAHSSPVRIDETKADYNRDNAPELFPDVPVIFQPACSPAAQE